MPKATVGDILAAIRSERDYQNAGMGNAYRPDMEREQEVGEFVLILRELVDRAQRRWYEPGGQVEALHSIRKIAAVAWAAMEAHGAPPRVIRGGPDGYTRVPGPEALP